MSKISMLDKHHFNHLVTEVSDELGIHPAIIEKDWHVTRVIQAFSEIKLEEAKLIFAGGTCLAKAHRIVRRMSEDVDFKLVLSPSLKKLNHSAMRKRLSTIHHQIKNNLKEKGFILKDDDIYARNNNHYVHLNLPYESALPPHTSLRPKIFIELTVADLQLPAITLPIQTLIADVIGNLHGFPNTETACINIIETAAEKWVAFIRRTAMADRGYIKSDKTLIRHLYDLYYIFKSKTINEEFTALLTNIVLTDKLQFNYQYPEFAQNPIDEIIRGLSLIENNMNLPNDWDEFVTALVLEKPSPTYMDAFNFLMIINNLSLEYLINNLSKMS